MTATASKVRGVSNGGNVTRGVKPAGVRLSATPATYAGAAVIAMPPAKSPGTAAPAGICPTPSVNPCGMFVEATTAVSAAAAAGGIALARSGPSVR